MASQPVPPREQNARTYSGSDSRRCRRTVRVMTDWQVCIRLPLLDRLHNTGALTAAVWFSTIPEHFAGRDQLNDVPGLLLLAGPRSGGPRHPKLGAN